ncbi:uncharacterized protein [Diabrotica undecimpunctata]|uniref:uncharacterized protein n=1 Tax=Diabrotica undecimpunctata TaxID=50387 RepID=UPI003B63D69E
MIFKVLFLTLAVVAAQLVFGRRFQDDVVEWVDYHVNSIPENAINIGKTQDDKNIYIGLVHFLHEKAEGFIPTSIVEGEECVYGLQEFNITKYCNNIKILVGKNDYTDTLYWKNVAAINFTKLFNSDDHRPVRAGWETFRWPCNTSVYIGRPNFDNRNWVGKIFNSHINWQWNDIPAYPYINISDPYKYDHIRVQYAGVYDVLMFKN